jgi:tripartite-type tricarboxylate transporter receptor subunit TctC
MQSIKNTLVSVFLCLSTSAWAGVVEIVVPFNPGGTTDIVGRYISKILTDSGITNIVTNKPGAQGLIGTRYVVDHPNKQTTLLILGTGPGLYAPLLSDKPPYDVHQDFQMVASVATDSVVAIVSASNPINDVKTLIDHLRQRPGQMTFGHGASSHRFAGLLFLDRTKTLAIDVPYNGANPVAMAVAGNHIDFGFVDYTAARALHRDGKIKIIGIASTDRHHQEKDIKTFREQGIDFEQQAWFLVAAPRGIDPETIQKFNKIINDALKKDTSSTVYTDMSLMIKSPGETSQFLLTQYALYQRFIESIKEDQKKSQK